MPHTYLTRTRLGLLLAVAVGVLLGAVFGQPSTGSAAATAVPKNKTLPTISGTALVGQTLTATHGTWTGKPTSFSYSWSRCDTAGNACVAIPHATAKIYTVTGADVGKTLRVTVTAHNGSGASTPATSAQTGIVPLSGCPPGNGTIQISALAPPAQLEIGHARIAPPVTRSSKTIRIHAVVTACSGRAVQGATVFAVPIPYNQFAGAQATSGSNGTVTITGVRQAGFPAGPRQRLLAVFMRATSPTGPVLGGVSARRVFGFKIGH
jgi:hypothetical protein